MSEQNMANGPQPSALSASFEANRALEKLMTDLAASHDAQVAQLRADLAAATQRAQAAEGERGCPCLYVEPCLQNCTCASPTLSGGCLRCARYGSPAQKRAKARMLAMLEANAEAADTRRRRAVRWAWEKRREARQAREDEAYWASLCRGLNNEGIKPLRALKAERDALAGQVAQLRAALEKPRSTEDSCGCDRCSAAIERGGEITCIVCGYHGRFSTLTCGCYDYRCPGGNRSGPGCPHGALTCPVCDDGEADFSAWQLMKELRARRPRRDPARSGGAAPAGGRAPRHAGRSDGGGLMAITAKTGHYPPPKWVGPKCGYCGSGENCANFPILGAYEVLLCRSCLTGGIAVLDAAEKERTP